MPAKNSGISGLVVEYIVAIDVTQVRFPADASFFAARSDGGCALVDARVQPWPRQRHVAEQPEPAI